VATTNVTVSATWTLVAGTAASDVLISVASGGPVEVASTADASTAPTVSGHHLVFGAGLTRDLIGAGAIWARAIPPLVGATASAIIAVNA